MRLTRGSSSGKEVAAVTQAQAQAQAHLDILLAEKGARNVVSCRNKQRQPSLPTSDATWKARKLKLSLPLSLNKFDALSACCEMDLFLILLKVWMYTAERSHGMLFGSMFLTMFTYRHFLGPNSVGNVAELADSEWLNIERSIRVEGGDLGLRQVDITGTSRRGMARLNRRVNTSRRSDRDRTVAARPCRLP